MSCQLYSFHNIPLTSTANRRRLPMTASKGKSVMSLSVCVSMARIQTDIKLSEAVATENPASVRNVFSEND